MQNETNEKLKKESIPENYYKFPGYIYLIKITQKGYQYFGTFKIGKAMNVSQRLKAFKHKYKLIHTIYSNDYDRADIFFRKLFEPKCVSYEYFDLNEDDLESIKSYKELIF